MAIYHIKLAFSEKRTSDRKFVHDGFLPIMLTSKDGKTVLKDAIKKLCPQFDSKTKLIVIGKTYDEEITFWVEGQLDKFYDWLHIHCRNEEKEVYIEHSFVERMSTVKTAQHKFKKACVPAQMMMNFSTDRCKKCVCNRCMYDLATVTEQQENLSDRLELVENSLRLLKENSQKRQEEKLEAAAAIAE